MSNRTNLELKLVSVCHYEADGRVSMSNRTNMELKLVENIPLDGIVYYVSMSNRTNMELKQSNPRSHLTGYCQSQCLIEPIWN